jgi:hypothetical protein
VLHLPLLGFLFAGRGWAVRAGIFLCRQPVELMGRRLKERRYSPRGSRSGITEHLPVRVALGDTGLDEALNLVFGPRNAAGQLDWPWDAAFRHQLV